MMTMMIIFSLTFAALYKHTDLYSERLKLKCFYLNVQKAKSITPTKFQWSCIQIHTRDANQLKTIFIPLIQLAFEHLE